MLGVKFDKKIALYVNGHKITDHIYDDGKCGRGIVCMKINSVGIDVYDSNNGNFKFTKYDVANINITEDSIITVSTSNCYGVYDFYGKEIIPMKYYKITKKGSYYIAKEHTVKFQIAYLLQIKSKYMGNKA